MDENEAIMSRVNARKVFPHGCAHGTYHRNEALAEYLDPDHHFFFELVTFSSRSGTSSAAPNPDMLGLDLFYWPHRTGD